LASAVIALAGIPFRILVGEHGPGGFEHRLADKVFRGDEFQPFMLAANFVVDGVRNLGINFIERAGHGGIFHNWVPKPILPGCSGKCSADTPVRERLRNELSTVVLNVLDGEGGNGKGTASAVPLRAA